jgi:hypothetical protein
VGCGLSARYEERRELARGRVAAGGMTEGLAHSVTTSFATRSAGGQYRREMGPQQGVWMLAFE